jgi:hypothetical protein
MVGENPRGALPGGIEQRKPPGLDRNRQQRVRLDELSAEPVGGTPADMAAFMKRETERWRGVIRSASVRAD